MLSSTSSSSSDEGAGSAAGKKPMAQCSMATNTVAKAIQVPVATIRTAAAPHAIVAAMTIGNVIAATRAITEIVVQRGIIKGKNIWIMTNEQACGAKDGSKIERINAAIVK